MADTLRCCICKHYDFGSSKCSEYPEGIPKDIFIQIKDCHKYSKNEVDDKYTYPTAIQGR